MEPYKRLTLDDIYISPFTARRRYDEDGVLHWVPLERKLNPTGQPQLDYIVGLMNSGRNDLKWLARMLGCKVTDLHGLAHALFGMNATLLRREYIFRMADDLLRYTSMSIDEIARRTGCHCASSLCQQFVKHRGFTPDARRQALRRERDEDRYKV